MTWRAAVAQTLGEREADKSAQRHFGDAFLGEGERARSGITL